MVSFYFRARVVRSDNREFRKKISKNITENAQGVVLMAVASIIWNIVKSNLLRMHYVYLLGLLTIFHNVFRAS